MKTLPLLAVALLTGLTFTSCSSHPGIASSMEDHNLATLESRPVVSDRLEVQNGKTYRVRRFLTNESPRETIVKVELAKN